MAKPNAKAPLGQGGRFAAMVASGKSPALAAYIGRKKYGKAGFAALSHMPKGATQSPSGDIGEKRQMESVAVGGFKAGRTVKGFEKN